MKTRGQIRNVEGRKDISEGKESNKIPVRCNLNIPLPEFEYITEHSRANAFYIPADRLDMKGCKCETGNCDTKFCECIKYSNEVDEVLECGRNCACNNMCKNRKFSNGILPQLYLKYGQKTHGFGVFANQQISKGAFVAAYVGEIAEIRRFTELLDSDYTYSVYSNVSKSFVEIDATHNGNIARFFNHSCKSNLKTGIAYFGLYRMPYPVFLAKRDINVNEQLTINYGNTYFKRKGIPCKCENCY